MIRPFVKGLVLAVALATAGGVSADEKATKLADIQSELDALSAQLQSLRSELTSGGASAMQAAGGSSALDRMNAMEAQLAQLTSRTEALQIRIEKVVKDGTNRIGDLEFRLCELEEGCDPSSLPETPTLGGAAPAAAASAPAATTATDTGATASAPAAAPKVEMAMNEQADFDRAKAALDGGDYQGAVTQFTQYVQNYPGGPLSTDAQFYQGEALSQTGDTAGAARAYLAAFSGQPEGPRAPSALTRLGAALGLLGQTQDACMTLSEVGKRFPAAPEVADATAAMQKLGCQ